MIEQQDTKRASAHIFSLLAELYKVPEYNLWYELKYEQLLEVLQQESSLLINLSRQEDEFDIPDTFEDLKDLYQNTLSPLKKGAAQPIESIYKRWTSDPTCQMPFANSKGYIMGDSALHIKFILDEFQMEVPEEFHHIPDHLAILLELLAYFIEHSPNEFVWDYLNDHFDWLEEYLAQLSAVSDTDFYPMVTRMVINHVEGLKQLYKQKIQSSAIVL